MSVEIYHNPRCSKSRATLALLEEKGITPNIRLYLENPPTEEQLADVISQLGISPRELLRKGEAEYKENNLNDDSLSDQQIIALMVQFPRLIERPIVITNGQARIGRPPESVLEIL
ncbi:arsenate reductase (glutaredoxin) [Amphritea sp. 2_MG-2023]|uniref:arsenate reductase (glutaredoxin) n=1 Tax=Amphritea TaxID=515417 RepID=UPI001C06767C|nr:MULTISPECIES: arsenate reductase (glutaredoxin) [Amphritea]MBU2966318.1 arsenate reductase (glutaredoxin) [Amphritea atlantica]MDO6420257.1 arsenate reductase (glutaredoxin) [Amphritea sp. 2_MG-2023]MDX2421476.1 arsenate reductase (glutaredoxin) [Amphritea sp.]